MKKIFTAILLLATFIFSGCDTQAAMVPNVRGDLKISMLNIGHGDSILIRTSKQTILIDTGSFERRDMFIKELEKLSVTKIDKLILTHPHSDHIGNARPLINHSKKESETYPYLDKISVAEVYDNGFVYGSGTYTSYVKSIKDKGIYYQHLKIGDTLDFGGGVKFKVLFPTPEFLETSASGQFDKEDRTYNINNGSIVGKLTYKDFSMMFTGDCERESEAKILLENDAMNLKCDILKAGHHSSYTSSTNKFVAAISPECVLISCAGNDKNDPYGSYAHPNLRVLKTYLAHGVNPKNIYCTRWNRTITVTSDGRNFSVQPEVEEYWIDRWIAIKTEERKNKEKNK